MKFKALLLTAAVSAASFSGSAYAKVDLVTADGLLQNSDFVLTILDSVNNLAYVQNLDNNNALVIEAAAPNFSGSFNLDASKLAIFSSSNLGNLTWSLSAYHYDSDAPQATGVISTSTTGAQSIDDGIISSIGTNFKNLVTAINVTTPIGTGALAASGSSITNGNLVTAVKNWQNKMQSAVGFQNAAKSGVSQDLWYLGEDPLGSGDAAPQTKLSANVWKLDLSNLSSNATVSSAPIPTPLPAAAWLMLSALMGLGGIARRRNAKV